MISENCTLKEINSVFCCPKVTDWIREDGIGSEITKILPTHTFLKCLDGDKIAGIICFVQTGAYSCSGHYAFLPEYWGKSIKYGREGINWAFTNGYKKITGRTPVDNRSALAWVKRLGFEIEGVDKESIMVNGQMIDQIYFGLRYSKWA